MKIIRLTICLFTLCFFLPISAQLKGDVNRDKTVNISDVVACINVIAGNTMDSQDEAVITGICPDHNHPHAIDLGIGVKFACCNVGASAPWEAGGYFSWGETEVKNIYNWDSYTHYDAEKNTCRFLTNDISKTDFDVAHVKWGTDWQMPSYVEFNLIRDNCTKEEATLNKVAGTKFTAQNGASIFLPQVGRCDDTDNPVNTTWGYYWTSSPGMDGPDYSYSFNFIDGSIAWANVLRFNGQPIRPITFTNNPNTNDNIPVIDRFRLAADVNRDGEVDISDIVAIISIMANGQPDPSVNAGLCPDSNHPHAIDLGFGFKFSCCNIGASVPWERGDFYAWGETEPKGSYTESNYSYYENGVCQNIGEDIAGTQYDVAYVKWGKGWHIPRVEQYTPLTKKCTKELMILNDIEGIKYTAPNGSSIFLPGVPASDDFNYFSDYWISTAYPSEPNCSFELASCSEAWEVCCMDRYNGLLIRPVFEDPDEKPDEAVKEGICPNNHHPHVIDMGPAGKWSCCNIGASTPWEYGDYFAWGETETKDDYSQNCYVNFTHNMTGCIAYDDSHDVAINKWGSIWCMPNNLQIDQLKQNCTYVWIKLNDVNGLLFTASNGSSIFLPASGEYDGNNNNADGIQGEYWSAMANLKNQKESYSLRFSEEGMSSERQTTLRFKGLSVRPVMANPQQYYGDGTPCLGLCPDHKHPHAIDLGFGIKFACCNIGADYRYPNYYGNLDSHEEAAPSFDTLNYNFSGTEYDFAHVQWGGEWQMPTYSQFKQLTDSCSEQYIVYEDMRGILFTGKNGNTIFLPDHPNPDCGSLYITTTPWWGILNIGGEENGYQYSEYGFFAFAFGENQSENWFSCDYNDEYAIRPIIGVNQQEEEKTDPAVNAKLCPDSNHPHVIDMGNAGKWSCCNVGASVPWETGEYYAWGETMEKSEYSWSNYVYYDENIGNGIQIGNEITIEGYPAYDIAGTEYDVAHVKWGGNWQMPSWEQSSALLKNAVCTEELTLNYKRGIFFTAENGNSIFWPMPQLDTHYWTSSYIAYEDYYGDNNYATLFGGEDYHNVPRYIGHLVRPISK